MSPSRVEESRLTKLSTAFNSAPRDDDLSGPLAQNPPRERKRPLRTYGGKRSAHSGETDTQPHKKQKLNEQSEPKLDLPQPTPLPAKPSQKEPPKRGSIMSYFKPAPPSSRAPSPQPATPAERALTPPPSSPITFGKARKRRLTTRPRIDSGDTCTIRRGSENWDGQEDGDNLREGDKLEGNRSSAPPGRAESGAEPKTSLAETSPDTLNRSSLLGPAETRKKAKLGKRQTKERVQMTLSLAVNPGPGFTICKDCGILFNPLNEKDRKEHKKQHAAHVRAKLKGETAS